MKIKFLKKEEVYPLRSKILRNGKSFEYCKFDGDDFETTFHIGNEIDEELISIASFYNLKNNNLDENIQYQLRGMATDSKHQGKGFGKALITYGITLLKEKNVEILWCNARANAVDFYEKLGFQKFGNSFEIEGIGLHFSMKKKLTK